MIMTLTISSPEMRRAYTKTWVTKTIYVYGYPQPSSVYIFIMPKYLRHLLTSHWPTRHTGAHSTWAQRTLGRPPLRVTTTGDKQTHCCSMPHYKWHISFMPLDIAEQDEDDHAYLLSCMSVCTVCLYMSRVYTYMCVHIYIHIYMISYMYIFVHHIHTFAS